MLIVMRQDATKEQIDAVIRAVEDRGCSARSIPGGERVSIGVLYNRGPIDKSVFQDMSGVKEAIAVTRPYKLVSREVHPHDTVIRVGNVDIGGKNRVIIGGPCAVES
ncbi:MAG: 3-deoxy-7-phosphoheptulonate synthase, partial [Desulfobacterales bacterium]|nr:3-deoxy-7-phosphoheptulonate synthase [Desulfobacterales bacterium]